MPHISIRERFRPFSHTPGVPLLFPGSSLSFKVFPTFMSFEDLEGDEKGEISFPLEGPMTGFTVLQDLEKGEILIFGKDKNNFFRFKVKREGESVVVVQEKGGTERWSLPNPKLLYPAPKSDERLSVVSLKHQSIERLFERGEWVDLLGPLYRLLVWYPALPMAIENSVEDLMLGGFEGLLHPTGRDTKHLGYPFSFEKPISFLRALRFLITSLFVEEKGDTLLFGEHFPKKIPAGRLKGLNLGGAFYDLEWRKGIIRRIAVTATDEKTLNLTASGLKSARVDKRKIDLSKPLLLPKEERLFLDRFEKA